MIAFACARCGMKFSVKDEFTGRSTSCPSCKNVLVVPLPSVTVPVPAGQVEGTRGTLAHASLHSDVTLEQALPAQANRPSIRDLLHRHHLGSKSRYLIEDEIARGGMGAVLRAIDSDIRREVALKYMLDPTNAAQKTRFVEEAQITGQLEHPNIVPIHELGIDSQQRLFFSMKMVHGRSLAEAMKDRAWTQGRLLHVLVNVCHALAFAHSRRVVHRDLKPANIMLGDFGEVYVMDWGLAKVLTSRERERPDATSISTSRSNEADLTQDGAILGTPVYMPPEQATGQVHEVDERSDMYSLGAILYELLTGHPPIAREGGPMAVLLRVAEGEIIPPQERVKQAIPLELSAIAMKALAKEKQDRYPTVTAFREDIERHLEGRSVSAKQDTTWEMFKKLVKRNRGVSVSTAIGAVVLLVVTVLFLKSNIDAKLEARTAYHNYKAEQEARKKLILDSVPAFARAARQAISEDRLDDAKALADSALEFDSESAEARLVRAQLLIGQLKFDEAAAELFSALKKSPGLEEARKLQALLQEAHFDEKATLPALANELTRQKLFPLAERLTKRLETMVRTRAEMLAPYRSQIDAVWKGASVKLTRDEEGFITFSLPATLNVRDLSPLRGIPINALNLANSAQLQDIAPLKDMPLENLNLQGTQVKDLGPLRKMKLRRLVLNQCNQLDDLSPLRDLPLTILQLEGCTGIKDLTPLKTLPLTELVLSKCTGINDLTPLKGMRLETLNLDFCRGVRDLKALEKMPLTSLSLARLEVEDLSPLQGMKLTSLDLTSVTRLQDLTPLQGMPLTVLRLQNTKLRHLTDLKGMKLTTLDLKLCLMSDLSPLREMPLTSLDLSSCREVRDLTPLQGLPLVDLRLANCGIGDKNLTALRGLKLRKLSLLKCPQLSDVTPLEGMPLQDLWFDPGNITKGIEGLRKMETLQKVWTSELASYSRFDFWKRYDAGEFKK